MDADEFHRVRVSVTVGAQELKWLFVAGDEDSFAVVCVRVLVIIYMHNVQVQATV